MDLGIVAGNGDVELELLEEALDAVLLEETALAGYGEGIRLLDQGVQGSGEIVLLEEAALAGDREGRALLAMNGRVIPHDGHVQMQLLGQGSSIRVRGKRLDETGDIVLPKETA